VLDRIDELAESSFDLVLADMHCLKAADIMLVPSLMLRVFEKPPILG